MKAGKIISHWKAISEVTDARRQTCLHLKLATLPYEATCPARPVPALRLRRPHPRRPHMADPVRVSLRAHQGNTERLRDLQRRQDVPDLLHMIEIMTG